MTIASFNVDHKKLKPGVYVSRVDNFGGLILTTFDLRYKEPNNEPVMDHAALHTLEHLGATFFRSHKKWGKKIVYFGPMGCRTGFYLIVAGNDVNLVSIFPLICEMTKWIESYNGKIPGASASECGNWREHNLDMAKYENAKYMEVLSSLKARYPKFMEVE